MESLLRSALEAAVIVARSGENEVPVQPSPVGLRPFLQFAKLPPRALAATKKALDHDEIFRLRVAALIDESVVGRAGWLYLQRPDGWGEELAELEAEAARVGVEITERRAETNARRRVEQAEAVAAQAVSALAARETEFVQLRDSLAAERLVRRDAVRQAEDLVRRLEATVAIVEQGTDQAESLRLSNETLARKVERLQLALDEERRSAVDRAPPLSTIEPAGPAQHLETSATELRAMAATLASLVTGLEGIAGDLSSAADMPPTACDTGGVSRSVNEGVPSTRGRSRSAPRPVRVPVSIPGGVFDDSTEAAVHLVRRPSVVILVDGYNVSQEGWPGMSSAEQRQRLLDAMTELAIRSTARIEVVFDGADEPLTQPHSSRARTVKVSFSPPGVEADQVLVERAAALPLDQAVIVVSSDKEVRAGAARLGANLLSSTQLLAVAGRRGPSRGTVSGPR